MRRLFLAESMNDWTKLLFGDFFSTDMAHGARNHTTHTQTFVGKLIELKPNQRIALQTYNIKPCIFSTHWCDLGGAHTQITYRNTQWGSALNESRVKTFEQQRD